jgi:two-component system chemotaxis sensor kinase CheA
VTFHFRLVYTDTVKCSVGGKSFSGGNGMVDDAEFFQIFVVESRELIESVEPKLIELQQRSDSTGTVDKETINNVFRLFHSMKGSAGSLNLNNVANLTHGAETLLDLLRSGKAQLQPSHIDLFLRTLDLTRIYLDEIEQTLSDQGHEAEKKVLETEQQNAIDSIKGKSTGKPKPKMTSMEAPNEAPPPPPIPALAGIPPDAAPLATPVIAPTAAPVAAPKPPVEPTAPASPEATVPTQPTVTPGVPLISPKLVERFLSEAHEILEQCEKDLLELEKNPKDNPELIREILGYIHGFKGNCGFMGFPEMEKLSHKTETVLEVFLDRDNTGAKAIPAKEDIMTFLMVIDSLREGIEDLSRGGKGAFTGREAIEIFLGKILEGSHPSSKELKIPQKVGEILLEKGEISPTDLQEALAKQLMPVGEILVDMGKAKPEQVEEALKIQQDQQVAASAAPGGNKFAGKKDIRVDLRKLDTLINLVGELVIAESMVTRNPEIVGLQLESFERATHHLRRITTELQDIAMSVRMVPLSATFQKLVRVIHDLSQKVGKKIRLELIGEETEVDKTMTEHIADPLLHMVRNSVDHGVETITERLAAGKPETGVVKVEARHEGGEVQIIISDDGHGLNRAKLLAKGIDRGLVKGDGSDLSDEDVYKLIFEPGLSTAEKVTEVSGRGVGMDVVKKNIEKLKGRISIQSTWGQGTTIIIHIPLTLAIIEGMLVRVSEGCYTVPILSIRESLRPKPEFITITPDGQEVVRVREELVPIVRLHELFNKKPQFSHLHDGILVLVEDQGKMLGLFVDEIIGQQQTVIKALPNYLSTVRGVSGCTILGDGSISLILDINGLLSKIDTAVQY